MDEQLSSTVTQEDGLVKVQRLSALDLLFRASGLVTLRIVRGGKEVRLELPIKSVDNEEAEAIARPFHPKVPVRREQINGKWTTVVDEANPEYLDKLAEYNRVVSYVWILLGLDVDVSNRQGEVVWSADNTVRNLQESRTVLKQMGLVDNHLITIMRAIRGLTTDEAEINDRE